MGREGAGKAEVFLIKRKTGKRSGPYAQNAGPRAACDISA
jgi:hypothetical protein